MFSRKIQALEIGAGLSLFVATGAANAPLITQTINFSFSGFGPFAVSMSPTLISDVTGEVLFTYDSAATTSIFGQAVDSVSFSTPAGFFLTSDVKFDLKLCADKITQSNDYEFDFYHDELSVRSNLVGDWLFRIGALGAPGTSSPMGSQFLLIDRPGLEGFAHVSDQGAESLTSTSVPAATSVAEPAPLMVLGLGLAAFGLIRRRR